MAERKAPKNKPVLDPESETWNKLPWRKLEKHCFRIQKRIFRASQRGNTRAVHKLQKLLMRVSSSQAFGSSSSHTGEPRQENCWHRRGQIRQTSTTSGHGKPHSPEELERDIPAGAQGMDTEAWENREASARDSCHG